MADESSASAAFATVEDLEAGWRPLSEAERKRAATLLDRAAVILRDLVDVDEGDAQQAQSLNVVSCSMVQRAMPAGSEAAFGVTQQSTTAAGFSEMLTFSNPSGDMYLTKLEYKMLGISPGVGRMVQVAIHDCAGDEVAW